MNLVFYTNKDKKEIEIKVSDYQLRFISKFTNEVKRKIILKYLVFNSRIGLNDAMKTALLNGLINSFVKSSFCVLKNNRKSAKLILNSNPCYNDFGFTIACQITCFITLFDIIYTFLIVTSSLKNELKASGAKIG